MMKTIFLLFFSSFFLLSPGGVIQKKKIIADSFTDSRDGKVYRVVQIGDLFWLAENLRFRSQKSVCYDNQEKYEDKYGRMYPFSEAVSACPNGWRLPEINDWKKLRKYIGTKKADALIDSNEWTDQKFSEGNNSSLLSILPGGRYDAKVLPWYDSPFEEMGESASFWLNDSIHETHWHVRWGVNEIHHHPMPPDDSIKFSIRCICDSLK